MQVHELNDFRRQLNQIMKQSFSLQNDLIELFEHFHFPAPDKNLRAKKRRCRVQNEIIAVWPSEETQRIHQVGLWSCTEFKNYEQRMEWCPYLNTLILYSKSWSEGSYHLRSFIDHARYSRYHLISPSEAIQHLFQDKDKIKVNG